MENISIFRRTRIPKRVGPFFHLFVCVHHGYVALCLNKKRDLTNITDQRVLDMEVFAPLFFTSWNFLIQLVYFTSALMYDILHMLSIRRDIQEKMLRYKGYIFTSSLFPFSVFVSTMFWSLYNINREFVLPEVLDKYIPTWLNHCLHTNILIFAAIEMLIANQLLPTFISAFFGLNVIVISYHTLLILTYFWIGRWPYGLFYIFTWPERITFFFSYYLFTVWMMKVGMTIQKFKQRVSIKKSERCKTS